MLRRGCSGRVLTRLEPRPAATSSQEPHAYEPVRYATGRHASGDGPVGVGLDLQLVGEDGLEAPGFVLVVQHYDGDYAQRLAARAAVGHFALHVLQKAIGKMILRALAAGILPATSAAVRTDVLDAVLLRIAVQSGPAGAAHANNFRVLPFHGNRLLWIHVHSGCDAQHSGHDTST